jgi:hypothetical protein
MDDDRFSFGAGFEEEPALEEERGTNRVFSIIVIGLVGLILLGLLGIAGYLIIIRPRQQEQRAAQATSAIAEQTAIAMETRRYRLTRPCRLRLPRQPIPALLRLPQRQCQGPLQRLPAHR